MNRRPGVAKQGIGDAGLVEATRAQPAAVARADTAPPIGSGS